MLRYVLLLLILTQCVYSQTKLIDYGFDITINVQNTATMPGCVYVSGTVGSKNIGSKCSYFSTPGATNAYTCSAELTLDQNNYD